MEGKGIRIAAIAIAVLLVGLFIFNMTNPSSNFTPWNEAMTLGDKESATRHYIMYTDIFCPYCDKFSNAVAAHEEDFKKEYIDEHHVLFEIRMTAMNYASGHSNNSMPAAEGAYCAANQNKFWEYYHAILAKLWDEYHSKGIGVDRNSERIPDLAMDWFYALADDAELDKDSFVKCLDEHETKAEVEKNTSRASNIVGGGVPYFQFGKTPLSGFAGNWDVENDWQQAKTMLNAGL